MGGEGVCETAGAEPRTGRLLEGGFLSSPQSLFSQPHAIATAWSRYVLR